MDVVARTLKVFLRRHYGNILSIQRTKRLYNCSVFYSKRFGSLRAYRYRYYQHRNHAHSLTSSCCLFYVSSHRFCDHNKPRKVINYFSLLNIAQQFDVDDKKIRTQFQDKMREYHPDKYATKSEKEQKEAGKISIQLNTARTVLESPLFRAQHLLSLINTKEAEQLIDDQLQIADQDFLFEILEIRTNVESTKDNQVLQEILNSNAVSMKKLIQDIGNQFKHDFHDKNGTYSIPNENIDNIRELLAKLTYFHRIEGEIKAKLPSRE